MAEYSGANQCLISYRYKAKSASVWSGETWSSSLRLWPVEGTTRDWDKGRTSAIDCTVKDSAVVEQLTDFNIEYGWDYVSSATRSFGDHASQKRAIAAVSAFLQAAKQNFGDQFELESIRLYPLSSTGKSLTAPTLAFPRNAIHNGTVSQSLPPDVSVAISWQTPSRGPSGRGRNFLGGIATGVCSSNGLIVAGNNQTFRNAAAGLIEDCTMDLVGDIGGAVGFLVPAVWTRNATKSGANANTATPINEVRTGDEFDTQRRRDRQRVDQYTSQKLPA